MVERLHLSPRHREEIAALVHKYLSGVEVRAYGSPVNGRSHDDGEPFEQKMRRLAAQWRGQQAEAQKLDAAIAANLKALGFGED